MLALHASCIEACDSCATACDACAAACLTSPHPQEMTRCVALDVDCAQVCRLTSALLARSSPLGREAAALCIRFCEACAAECQRHSADHCQKCFEVCTFCAQECRKAIQ